MLERELPKMKIFIDVNKLEITINLRIQVDRSGRNNIRVDAVKEE